MIDLLLKAIGHDRNKCGAVSGVIGICLNMLLFAFKLIAGLISNSTAIISDAINNFMDIGSSVITYIGFKIAGKPADKEHPYGHGRIEYIAGLFVAVLIIMMGFELAKTSIGKIINPEPVFYGVLSVVILAVSVSIKLIMYSINKKMAKAIDSSALMATAQDSLNDAIITSSVLAGIAISNIFKVNIDGILGALISIFILVSGINAIADTVRPILGERPDEEFIKKIKSEVTKDGRILGIHDLMVHNYGPGRTLMSLHAEVSSTGNVLELHDMIDDIEKELKNNFGCQAVIHMDPIVTDDERTNEMRAIVAKIASDIDNEISIHDFRMTDGCSHTNLIFDVVIPFGYKHSDTKVVEMIKQEINKLDGEYFAVIEVDKE